MKRNHYIAILILVIIASTVCFPVSIAEGTEDAAKEQIAEFLRRARAARTPVDQKMLSLEILPAVDEMLLANDFPSALRLATLAGDLARKARNNHVLTLANSKREHVVDVTREFKDVADAFKTLSRSPNDPEANFEAGRFTCLVKADWDTGLPMLLRGSEPAYRNLARGELDRPMQGSQQLALAQAWLDLANTESSSIASAMQWRSYYWAEQARSAASGADRDAVLEFMNGLPIRYLTDLAELNVQPGPWPLGKYGNTGKGEGDPIKINGVPYPHGLGLHPPQPGFASVSYRLGGQFNTFTSGVAINDHQTEVQGAVLFTVIGDGKVLWKSRPVSSYGDAQFCNVPIKDVDVLELRTQCKGANFGAHAVWLDPYVAQ